MSMNIAKLRECFAEFNFGRSEEQQMYLFIGF